ncbi:MAG: hypothetical protein GWN31_17860, partial [Candidatus Thorarchaeota archaeon]|nr:hypothetical protein [Candidatus Thorarchaeota archaeon]
VKKGKTILGIPFCGGEGCRLLVEEETAMEIIGFSIEENAIQRKCLACSKEVKKLAYLARTQ